jgi:hypothetical protein
MQKQESDGYPSDKDKHTVLALITLALIVQQNSLGHITAWVQPCEPDLGASWVFRFGRIPSYGTTDVCLCTGRTPSLARCR